MPQILLKSNDRVFLTGKTGSGKTYLAERLTRSLPRLVVLDGKGSLGKWNLDPWDNTGRSKLRGGEPARLRVVAPVKLDKLAEFWEEVLYTAFLSQNVVIYIDELYAVQPPNTPVSSTLFACYTRGRELGVGMWASTQRPVWIPLVAISESEHFFMFRLQLEEDKRRLSAFMGEKVLAPIEDDYGFWYMKNTDREPIYYEKLQTMEAAQPIKPEMVTIDKKTERKKLFDTTRIKSLVGG